MERYNLLFRPEKAGNREQSWTLSRCHTLHGRMQEARQLDGLNISRALQPAALRPAWAAKNGSLANG